MWAAARCHRQPEQPAQGGGFIRAEVAGNADAADLFVALQRPHTFAKIGLA